MMRSLKNLMAVGLLLSLAACAVYETRPAPVYTPPPAYTPPPPAPVDLEARINNQQTRIDRGIAARQLTRREAAILQDNLNWIKNRYARLRAERRLVPREVQRLEAMLDQNSRMIQDARRNPARRLY